MVPGIITVFSIVVIWLSLQLKLSPPMIVGKSMQPRVFPIFLMAINLGLVALLTLQLRRSPPAQIPIEPSQTSGSMVLLVVFSGLTSQPKAQGR